MDRAYSFIEIKAVNEDERIIEGVASTPTPDRMGDIVEPMGAKFALPLPLLWQHDSGQPIGEVFFAKPTKDGIPFKAKLTQITDPGTLKDRLDEAWQSIKSGLVKAVSIGFRDLAHEVLRDGGWRFTEWEWLELSAVTIPANPDATITQIRSLDQEARAASGERVEVEKRDPPGATGKRTAVKAITPEAPKEGIMNKTIAEQISAFEATRQAKSARMTEIMEKAAEEGVTLDEAQAEEYDTLEGEVKQIDEHLKRLNALETANKAKAVAVEEPKSFEEGAKLRGAYGAVTLKPKVEKGIVFTRLLGARYLAMKHHCAPWDIAKRWNDTPEVEAILRAAVTPGSTTDTTFAEPLVQLTNATGEFIDLLRAKEVIGRIPGFDRVPFNVKVPRGTTDPTAYWVGQGDVKPLSRPGFDSITMLFHKVAGIVPMTEELMKFSNPSAEVKVRDGLISALAYLTDRDFLDPTKAAVTGVSPASVTNGVTPVTASGTTADALRADLADLLQGFADANEDPAGIVFIMTPTQALNIGLMRNSLGQKEFPNVTMAGGELEGFPVITTTNIVATGGSPTDGYPIVAVNAPNVYLAEEGVEVDVSREASLQMQDAPDSPETASTVLVSLWQRNMVAIKAERFITWTKKHSTSVQFIQNAKYAA